MIRLSHRPQLGPLVFLLFLSGLVFALFEGPSWWWLVAYLVHFFIWSFGVGFGLHRTVAHQSADLPRWMIRLSSLTGVLGQVGSPISWRTVHVMHHAHSDGEKDPHSPSKLGWRVILGEALTPEKSGMVEALLAARSLRDPFLVALHKYYYLFSFAFVLLCWLGFGVHGMVYIALLPMGLSFLTLGLLNYFCHSGWGYRNYETGEYSTNIWWLWPLSFGENWHNNHHGSPRNVSAREKSFEFDLIYFYFAASKLFKK